MKDIIDKILYANVCLLIRISEGAPARITGVIKDSDSENVLLDTGSTYYLIPRATIVSASVKNKKPDRVKKHKAKGKGEPYKEFNELQAYFDGLGEINANWERGIA